MRTEAGVALLGHLDQLAEDACGVYAVIDQLTVEAVVNAYRADHDALPAGDGDGLDAASQRRAGATR